jgi:hypothetical protein
MREDVEPRSLSLNAALPILKAAGWVGSFPNAFGPDKELVGTVANTRDPNGRMNLIDSRHISSVADAWSALTVAPQDLQIAYRCTATPVISSSSTDAESAVGVLESREQMLSTMQNAKCKSLEFRKR